MRPLSTSTTAKLFATGFTVGPIVDSLHNQCLLRYDFLPISLQWPIVLQQNQNAFGDIAVRSSTIAADAIESSGIHAYPYYFCSSWIVPPLLGFAYVVLGGLLPRILESILESLQIQKQEANATPSSSKVLSSQKLRTRALLAVTTTAMIIKLSEFLETHPGVLDGSGILHSPIETVSLSLLVMIMASLSQWALLDQSIVALVVATVTAIGGPLAELPFVGHGAWTYIDQAADYFPLQNLPSIAPTFASSDNLLLEMSQALFGTSNYQDLALSSITGPCYFAVAMDAIALGRWFDTSTSSSSSS
uniref:Uncharacterized protein n=1 Tax=Pseudo-nitzschia arenysensis TaxID=697910 RepID=A0A7R9ZTI6_9STRA|mmetsp:Transcript_1177/g.2568  ORF Transcript_1177/g.2568 Transcript_1177/m.2568 type:complete len:304 (+) Transcript_1177:119-1030(+)